MLPYNHCDTPEKQIPLAIKSQDLTCYKNPLANGLSAQVVIPTADSSVVRLRLFTDSTHLLTFFHTNWPPDYSGEEADALIVAGRESAVSYGLPATFSEHRSYCDASRQVWMFETEYYGNVKITVRGLCSELSSFDDLFIHGCAATVNGWGVILSGMSGAGKTTLTAELRQILGPDIRIINDDWGPLSLRSGLLRFTGEPYLHMKYPSVFSIAPTLLPSPQTHLSENFQGDNTDPRARLLIPPAEVFGQHGMQKEARLSLFVLIIRDLASPPLLRWLSGSDIALFENGQYSAFYKRTEQFLNGSLFLINERKRNTVRAQHLSLLDRFPCIALNNSASPQEGAQMILSTLRELKGTDKQHPR